MDNSLQRISFPVSWKGFKINDTELHIFGDEHFKEYECKECKKPECIKLTDLFEKIIDTSNKNKTLCDVFIETSIQEFEMESIEDTSSYLREVVQMLKKKSPTTYVHFHSIDTRKLNRLNYYDPFIILYLELKKLFPKWEEEKKSVKENIPKSESPEETKEFLKLSNQIEKDMEKILSLIIDDIYNLIQIIVQFITQNDVVPILESIIVKFNVYKESKERKGYEKYVSTLDILVDRFNDLVQIFQKDRTSLYLKSLLELEIKEKDIAFYINKYVTELIDDEFLLFTEAYNAYKDNPSELYPYLLSILLLIPSFIMDGYTLSKMFLSIRPEKQVILYYGGNRHAYNISRFFELLSNEYPIIQMIGESGTIFSTDDTKKHSQCITNKNFETIFLPWMGNTKTPPKSKKFGLSSKFLEN